MSGSQYAGELYTRGGGLEICQDHFMPNICWRPGYVRITLCQECLKSSICQDHYMLALGVCRKTLLKRSFQYALRTGLHVMITLSIK